MTKEKQELLQLIEECEASRNIVRLTSLIEEYQAKFPHLLNSTLMRAAIKVYIGNGKPQNAYDCLISTTNRGYCPRIEEIELTMHGLLKHSDETSALRLFSSMGSYRLKPRTATLNLLIGFYLKEQRPDEARSTFRKLEAHGLIPNQSTYLYFLNYFIEKGDYKAAEKIREFMRVKRIPVDIRFYNGLLRLMERRRELEEIDKILSEMKQANIDADALTFDILLQAFSKANEQERIHGLLMQLRIHNLAPTSKTFNKMLIAMASSLTPERSKEILLEMSKQGLAFNNYTYYALILNLFKQEKYKEALQMLFELERKNLFLPIEAYGALFHLCCKQRLDPAVRVLWQQLQKSRLMPNNHILTTLLKYFLMRGEQNNVDFLLNQMKHEWRIKPNPFILSVLLDHYVEVLDFARLRGLLNQIKEEKIEVNAVMYNVLMKCFYAYRRYQQGGYLTKLTFILPEDGRIEIDRKETMTEARSRALQSVDLNLMKEQFERIFDLQFRPTVHIYNEILLYLLMRERFEELGLCISEMRSKDIAFNLTTFTFLIKAKVFSGDVEGARKIIGQMKHSGLQPTILHCALVFHAYCRTLLVEEAEDFMKEMQFLYQLKPNHVFYGSLIYAYSRRKEFSRVFEVFERMEQNGFMPDTETCNYILISLLEINEYSEARNFFEKMLLQGIKRNSHSYSYLVGGSLVRGDSESFLCFLDDCLLPGNIIDSHPFVRLLRYFYQVDNCEKILSVLLSMVNYCVQFDQETAPYISLCIQKYLGDEEKLPNLCKIIKKTIVDYSEDSGGALETLVESLKKSLEEAGLHDELSSLQQVQKDATELRKLWTSVNEAMMVAFTTQLDSCETQGGLYIPTEEFEEIRHQVFSLPTLEERTRQDVVNRLTWMPLEASLS